MKIWERLSPDCIHLNLQLSSKDAVLRFSAELFTKIGAVINTENLYENMRMREEIMSTGIGNGIAIPHTPSPEAKDAAMLLLRLAQPIDFDALDAEPVDIVIGLVVPKDASALHLQLLAGISRLCHSHLFMRAVREAGDAILLRESLKELEERAAAR